jgi:hypothetical protein
VELCRYPPFVTAVSMPSLFPQRDAIGKDGILLHPPNKRWCDVRINATGDVLKLRTTSLLVTAPPGSRGASPAAQTLDPGQKGDVPIVESTPVSRNPSPPVEQPAPAPVSPPVPNKPEFITISDSTVTIAASSAPSTNGIMSVPATPTPQEVKNMAFPKAAVGSLVLRLSVESFAGCGYVLCPAVPLSHYLCLCLLIGWFVYATRRL